MKIACALLALALLAGCGEGGVTFVIAVMTEAFLPGTELRVTIWDEDHKTISERQSDCTVRHDPETGEDTVHLGARL